MVSIPTIPPERLRQISSSVNVSRKNEFLKYLLSYWKLKRIKMNGVHLIKRLQAVPNHPPTVPSTGRPQATPIHADTWQGEYKYMMRLRKDLVRARLLCELVQKREMMKKDFVVMREECWDHESRPFCLFLHSILDEIAANDPTEIFAVPVDPEEVPDYLTVVHYPMDISTMRANVDAFRYPSVKALELDFNLMISNCILYNSKATVFYRTAVRLLEAGRLIFWEAERMEPSISYDSLSGMHLDDNEGERETNETKR
jgi:bromodomain and PHD finger-containing protein 1